MTRPVQLLIPAAGKGSRFSVEGFQVPKPLIPVLGIPMILWVISNFNLTRDDETLILCQEGAELPQTLMEYLKNTNLRIKFIEIDYITEGPASSLKILLDQAISEAPIICANSDQYVCQGIDQFIDSVREGKSAGQILTMEASGPSWSYISRDDKGNIVGVVEKKQVSDEATVGVYGWKSKGIALAALNWQQNLNDRVNNEFYVAPTYKYLIDNELEISTTSAGQHGVSVYGLGTPQDLHNFMASSESSKELIKVQKTLEIGKT